MKKHMVILVIFLFTLASTALAQKMTVKDSDTNVLMEVNDEGTKGSITLSKFAASTGPTTPTDKLYNVDGTLYWNGSALGTAGSAGGWTDGGTDVYLTTSTDKVGIGTSSPAEMLHVSGLILSESSNSPNLIRSKTSLTTGFSGFKMEGPGTAYWAVQMQSNTEKLFLANSTGNKMTISAAGDVGIGTTSPGAALDVDGRIHAAAHAASKGLRLPTNAGLPGAVTGTSEGDIVWDSSNDNLYVYDGSSFSQISGGGGGLWESGSNGVYEDDAGVIVGIDQAETLSNSGFSLAAGDLFIQDQLGVEGNVYTDGSFVAGSSLSIADGSITQLTGSALTVSLGGGAGDDFIVDTNTLVVESDNDRVGIGITAPAYPLDVDSTIGINNTQVLYLPDQSPFVFQGTLIIGTGGGNLIHTYNPEGQHNTAVGIGALNANEEGYNNTASGNEALYANTTGYSNTASGYQALYLNTTGNGNTASGDGALHTNSIGHSNTASGYQALWYNGYLALFPTMGYANTASGYQALYSNRIGDCNVGIGYQSHYWNKEGSNNTIIGYQAGFGQDFYEFHDRSGNVFIGYQAGYNETEDDKLYIENSNSSSPLIGGDFSTNRVGINTNSPSVTLEVSGTDAIQLPVGTTAERPSSPSAGMIRFNSTTSKFEGYDGTAWVNLH